MDDLFLPGELISPDSSLVKGHGTHTFNEKIVSSTFGVLSRVNKVLFIKSPCPLTYTGQIGDVVIGRVSGIYNKRWVLDGNTTNEMYLNFSAIMFPGIEPRRRLEEDELKMREYLNVGDLVCGQVQKIHRNGGMAIHTRNEKFKKLIEGVCINVPLMLIQRFKTQFIKGNGIEIIIGVNGLVWIGGTNIQLIRRIYNYVSKCIVDLIPLKENMLNGV